MEYIVVDRKIHEKLSEIQRRIRRLQNWGCIDSLKNLGADTQNQIGASFVSLKTLAGQYTPDEKIASLLWNTGKREEQIVACFLLPKKINKEKITQLFSNCRSHEIAEYIGSIYLSAHPELPEIMKNWIASSNPYFQTAALTAGARHLLLHKSDSLISPAYFKQLTEAEYNDRYTQLVALRYR